ncbi:MAG: TetR/AcrR family transcriptional regulator C-terminal domain-containing protein [Alphaproteobacteria bacterium]
MKPLIKKPSRNPSGRPKSVEKRQAILDSAASHFMTSGYEHASIEAIAKDAAVSKLTIYSHFSDKDDLFKAVIKRKCDSYNKPEGFSALKEMPPRQALEIIASNFIGLILSPDAIAMHRIVETESLRHPTIAALFYEAGPSHLKYYFADLLNYWVGKKLLTIPNIDLAIDQFFCLIKGETHMKMLFNLEKDPDPQYISKKIEAGVAMFLAFYGSPA